MNYHKISLSIIAVITVFGFVIPLGTVAYCDSVQVFDNNCLRLGGGTSSIFKLAGAEIYYEYLIYYMNPYLVENPHIDDEVFQLSGDPPKDFPDQIILKYDDERHGFQPEPRSVLINLKHGSAVTIFNESKLNYNVMLRNHGDAQLLGTINAENSWSGDFSNVGLYTYQLEPISEHDNRNLSVRIFVIDEPIKDLPKSIRHNIACQLMHIDHMEYPYSTGRSCGGYDSESITIDLHKSIRGASPEFKREFLDKISKDVGFLEPKISFEYDDSGRYWGIPSYLMVLSEGLRLK